MVVGIDVLEALSEHGSYQKAADALGIAKSTFQNRVQSARRKSMTKLHDGATPAPGYIITRDSVALNAAGNVTKRYVQSKPDDGDAFEVPSGHDVKGVSALVGPDGRVMAQWIKTREGNGSGILDALHAAFAAYNGAATAIPSCLNADDDTLTVYPLPDLHFGMYAWGKETGESYDIKIAAKMALESLQALVDQSRPSKRAVLLGLGDYFHANDSKAVTPGHAHLLDVDGRWQKVLDSGVMLAVQFVDMIARKHEQVEAVFLPGNHDKDAAPAITTALRLFYSSTDRITINHSPANAWYYRFGTNLLGATHGHTMKPETMAGMLATDRKKDWGETTERQFFAGHIHHIQEKEVMGVRVRTFRSPAARDAFNAGAGYRSGRSLSALTFHSERGQTGEHMVNIGCAT